jgi:hypothetical protein
VHSHGTLAEFFRRSPLVGVDLGLRRSTDPDRRLTTSISPASSTVCGMGLATNNAVGSVAIPKTGLPVSNHSHQWPACRAKHGRSARTLAG